MSQLPSFFNSPLFLVEMLPPTGAIGENILWNGSDLSDPKGEKSNVPKGYIFYTFTEVSGLGHSFSYQAPPSNKGHTVDLISGYKPNVVTFKKGVCNSEVELRVIDLWAEVTKKAALYSLPTYMVQKFIRIYVCFQDPKTFTLKSNMWFELSASQLTSFSYPNLIAQKSNYAIPIKSFSVQPGDLKLINGQSMEFTFKGNRDVFSTFNAELLGVSQD